MYQRFILLLALLLSERIPTQSQSLSPQVVASAGGFVLMGDNSLSFTVGQPVATLVASAGGSLTQGFQQLIKVSVITALEPPLVLELRAFPNPTNEYLRVEGPAATLTLTDVLGRPRWQGRSDGKPLLIDVHEFADGVYLLNFQTTQAIQSTRIVLQR